MAQLLRGRSGAITLGLVGYLFFVEFVSGVLQGYYIPLIPDLVEYLGIRDPDFNWFEAAQARLTTSPPPSTRPPPPVTTACRPHASR